MTTSIGATHDTSGGVAFGDNPLSSANLRYLVRQAAVAEQSGPDATRPLVLRFVQTVPAPVRREFQYCPKRQVAVDDEGRPLIETMGKEWESKSSTDGDEGAEENWGWEEK